MDRSIAVGGAALKVLVVTDKVTATQVISFVKPLTSLIENGKVSLTLAPCGKFSSALEKTFKSVEPDVLVLSRCTKPAAATLPQLARALRIPYIYHIDDDLLNVPAAIGEEKSEAYSDPERLNAIRGLISEADLLYASTLPLRNALAEFAKVTTLTHGDIYCSADLSALKLPVPSAWPVIGYMGSVTHANDLAIVLPALERLMTENAILRFEVFGSIEMPESMKRFGNRVLAHAPDTNYTGFVRKLQSLGWWIGLAPLEDNAFNRCKADTKWVEYTSAGIATIASGLPVYMRACGDGAGLLVNDVGEWYAAMKSLLTDAALRQRTIARARLKLTETYGDDALQQQVLGIFERAISLAAAR